MARRENPFAESLDRWGHSHWEAIHSLHLDVTKMLKKSYGCRQPPASRSFKGALGGGPELEKLFIFFNGYLFRF